MASAIFQRAPSKILEVCLARRATSCPWHRRGESPSESRCKDDRLSERSLTRKGILLTSSIEKLRELAIERDLNEAVNLAPGVHNTAVGTNRGISINGAMSFENVFSVNGVVINENIRGRSLSLFVEDAIQETSVTTSGISAEYGRFTGGGVNVLAKSGENEFSGSLRVNFLKRRLGVQDAGVQRAHRRRQPGPWAVPSGRKRSGSSPPTATLPRPAQTRPTPPT